MDGVGRARVPWSVFDQIQSLFPQRQKRIKRSNPTPRKESNAARSSGGIDRPIDMSYHPKNAVNADGEVVDGEWLAYKPSRVLEFAHALVTRRILRE